MMPNSISAMPAEIVEWLTAQTDTFSGITFLTEFPAQPKATPLRRTIVSVGIDSVKISDFFTENSEGEQVPDEYCRLAEIRIRFSIYVPYSSGGTACHKAFTRIVDCLNFKSDFNIKQSGCETIEADRDTDAFVMKSWVDIDAQFCPAESAEVQYAAFLPKTLFCSSHINDSDIHVSAEEKALWSAPYEIGYYFGTDSSQRTISVGYRPSLVIVSAAGYPMFCDDASGAHLCMAGIATRSYSSAGITMSSNGFTLLQGAAQNVSTTFTKLNRLNVDYVYIAFK